MKIKIIFILIIFSLWLGRDLLRPGFISTHDGLYHVVRLHQFHAALTAGQFPIRWAPDLLNGLGYPLFVINYHLPYYLAEAFHLIGFSLFTSIELVFLLSLVASSLTSFFLFYSWSKNNYSAFFASFLYLIAPYRLANIFERGALGEAVAYIFVPLIFSRSLPIFTIGLAGLILSHTVIAMIFLPLALIYFLFTRRPFLKLFLAILLAFGLSSFQLFPAIFERQFMKFDANLLESYTGHFKSIYQLLRLPHPDVNLGTRFQLGLSHSLITILGLILIKNRLKYFWFFSSLIAFFLVLPQSSFLWQPLLPLKMILYPWRFLGVIAFSVAALGALLKPRLPLFLLLVLITLYTNRHYLQADKFIPEVFPAAMLQGNATTQNEFDPIWFTGFKPTTKATLYFPGWSGTPDANGLIYGENLRFTETSIRKIGNLVSLSTVLVVILWSILL